MAVTYLSGGRTLIGVVLPSSYHQDLEPAPLTVSVSTTPTTADRSASLLDVDASSNDRFNGISASLVRPCRGSPMPSSSRNSSSSSSRGRHVETAEEDDDEARTSLTLHRRGMDYDELAQTIHARIPSPSFEHDLVELDVSRNRLTDLPQALVSLPNLRTLNAAGNRLASIPLVLLSHTQLTTLILSDNLIRDIPSHFPPALPHLQVLFIDGNLIESLPSTMAAWTEMTCLRLGTDAWLGGGNQITCFPEHALGQMVALVELQVDHNLLERLPPMPPGLQHLNASHNRLTALDEAVLHPCRHTLETLRLTHNLLAELPHGLVHLDRMELLDVSHNQLLRFPADLLELSDTSKLNILFTGNPINGDTPTAAAAADVDTGPRHVSFTDVGGSGSGSRTNSSVEEEDKKQPSLVNSLHELALRRAFQLGNKAQCQYLPEHLLHQLEGDEVGFCRMCKGPFMHEWMTSTEVKQYRGHPSVAREVRYCSAQCSRIHAARIEETIRQRQHQLPLPPAPHLIPLTTATRRWSLDWIIAAAEAAAEQEANDENDGFLITL